MEIKGVVLLLATVSCTATGQILMKKGVNLAGAEAGELTIAGALTSPQIVIGGLCYILGFALWLNVLRILDLSIAYPASSLVYVLVIILSSVFLAEPISTMKIAGITFICIGVAFIGFA